MSAAALLFPAGGFLPELLFGRASRGFPPGLRPFRSPRPALQLLGRVHRLAAIGGAAVAAGFVLIAVVQVVVIGQLFACGDVANRRNPYPAANLFGFAIGIAGVVDEHRGAVAVDDLFAVAQAEEVGRQRILIFLIGHLFADAGAGVLDNAQAFLDRGHRIAAGGVDSGRTNDQ